MTTNQPKTYLQARDECWNAYKESNPDMSEYMERDYKDGFHDGYHAALHDRERELRERAAIAAMQGMLAHGTATCSNEFIAGRAVDLGNALINQLNTPQS